MLALRQRLGCGIAGPSFITLQLKVRLGQKKAYGILKSSESVNDMSSSDGEVTLLLRAMKAGDKAAAEKLLPLVYSELYRVARLYMLRERNDHTLQPTALVNDALMRLIGKECLEWQSRAQFFAVSSKIMRHILIDHARAHLAMSRVERRDFERSCRHSM